MLNEKKVVPKLRQEMKVKVDIVTSDEIKIYYTGKFQDFTARYIIIRIYTDIILLHISNRSLVRLVVPVYLSSLPAAHLSDARRRQ